MGGDVVNFKQNELNLHGYVIKAVTAYLPSGKELRVTYDEVKEGDVATDFFMEGKRVASIPLRIPMLFNDLPNLQEEIEKQKKYDEMCRELQKSGFGTMGVQKPVFTVASLLQPNGTTKGIEVFYKNHLGYHSTEKLIYPNDIDETISSTSSNQQIKDWLIAKLSKNGLMQLPHIAATTVVSWKFI